MMTTPSVPQNDCPLPTEHDLPWWAEQQLEIIELRKTTRQAAERFICTSIHLLVDQAWGWLSPRKEYETWRRISNTYPEAYNNIAYGLQMLREHGMVTVEYEGAPIPTDAELVAKYHREVLVDWGILDEQDDE